MLASLCDVISPKLSALALLRTYTDGQLESTRILCSAACKFLSELELNAIVIDPTPGSRNFIAKVYRTNRISWRVFAFPGDQAYHLDQSSYSINVIQSPKNHACWLKKKKMYVDALPLPLSDSLRAAMKANVLLLSA